MNTNGGYAPVSISFGVSLTHGEEVGLRECHCSPPRRSRWARLSGFDQTRFRETRPRNRANLPRQAIPRSGCKHRGNPGTNHRLCGPRFRPCRPPERKQPSKEHYTRSGPPRHQALVGPSGPQPEPRTGRFFWRKGGIVGHSCIPVRQERGPRTPKIRPPSPNRVNGDSRRNPRSELAGGRGC